MSGPGSKGTTALQGEQARRQPQPLGRWPFLYLGLMLADLGLAYAWPGGRWLMLWAALAHGGLALAFWRRDPSLLGKRPDGRLTLAALLFFLPYLAFLWSFFHLKRLLLRREDCWNEVAPGIYVGRRPLAGEMPADVNLVVDAMAELPESAAALAAPGYVCLPTLNRLVPEDEPFRALILRLAVEKGPLYIHCGAGKGRSATVAAALLIARGLAGDVEEATLILKRARPIVSLHPVQQELVRRLAANLSL